MDKMVSKETLLRQVDGLRDLARRARRLAEMADEREQTRLGVTRHFAVPIATATQTPA